tara:strand:+ start:1315 stop:1617 length:303 start_codon:yes stop_codon:yes gene_type:complete
MGKFITYKGILAGSGADGKEYTRTVLLENIGLEIMVSIVENEDEEFIEGHGGEEVFYFLEDYNDRVKNQRFLIEKSEYDRILKLINNLYGVDKGKMIGRF